jgi:predicted amidohydrolase YtcJ
VATFFSGGTIWCGIGCVADSVRIDGDKIVEINGAAHAGDEVVDLAGAFLAPAFMDGHAHPLFGGREAQGPLVNGLQTVAEMVAEVKRFADANPNTPWIVGGAYEAAAVSGGDFLATWLDEAVSDRSQLVYHIYWHS